MARFYHIGGIADTTTIRLREIPYGTSRPDCGTFDILPMSSSLEDRIRLLTDQAIAAKTQSELDAILPELKAAIRDHIRYLRAIAVETIPEASGKSNAAD
jgi:hypothetical protein